MIAILQSYSSMLLGALGKTLLLTLLSLLFAMIIGMIFALMNVGRNRVLNCIGTIYVDAVRGVPLIVLAYFIYFGVPSGMKMMGATDFRLSALQAGTIALAMNCGAYMAEIIRAGIQSVDKGQMEASRSLGLSYAKSMRLVILPQATVRWFRPSSTSSSHHERLLRSCPLSDSRNLPTWVMTIAGNTFKSLQTWAIVGIMYMIVIVALSKLAKRIERRIDRGR